MNSVRFGIPEDFKDIVNVFKEVAPEIPWTCNDENEIHKLVESWFNNSDKSYVLVSTDETDKAVGFLSYSFEEENVYLNRPHVYIGYVGVKSAFRRENRFDSLLNRLIEITKTAPLRVIVKHNNLGNMAAKLTKRNFWKGNNTYKTYSAHHESEDVYFLNYSD